MRADAPVFPVRQGRQQDACPIILPMLVWEEADKVLKIGRMASETEFPSNLKTLKFSTSDRLFCRN